MQKLIYFCPVDVGIYVYFKYFQGFPIWPGGLSSKGENIVYSEIQRLPFENAIIESYEKLTIIS